MSDSAERSITYAGLSIGQIPRLAQAVKQCFGAAWTIQPWLGRLQFRVVVVGHGVQAERARTSASAALIRVVSAPEDDSAFSFAALCQELRLALALATELPNPFQHLLRMGGLLPEIARSQLDARTRIRGIAWRHPQAGLLVVQPRHGWVGSEQRSGDVVGELPSSDWVEVADAPDRPPAIVSSLEHWMFHAMLRWREQTPVFPSQLRLRLSAFPDVAAVSGQPRLLHALLAIEEQRSLSEVSALTGCPSRLVDALVMALATSGLIADFDLRKDSAPLDQSFSPQPVAAAPMPLHGLRRIAHFLGISRAMGW